MQMKDAGITESEAGENLDESIYRQIALLWQTRPLRRERLFVADEVENALTYLREIFLPVLPSLYARWERELGYRPPSFLRAGSWIGGDRDGNPYVQADSLRLALSRACEAAIVHYLDALHALGAELSISTEIAEVPQDLLDLADRRGDNAPPLRDEPYRRSISGIYARLAATHERLCGQVPPRPSALAAAPTGSHDECRLHSATLATGPNTTAQTLPAARHIT